MTGMRPGRSGLALVGLIAAGCAVAAGAARAQPVTVKDAWVRAPAPGQKVAGAYMELVSRTPLALTGVASAAAARAELHSTSMEGGVMRMRPVARIELPAGSTVKLAPGGLHIMLVDLRQPLKPGDKVALTLTVQRADFASSSVFTVTAVVRAETPDTTHRHRGLEIPAPGPISRLSARRAPKLNMEIRNGEHYPLQPF